MQTNLALFADFDFRPDILALTSLTCSIIGSIWLLCALQPLQRHLFNRQLWHLAIADLGLSTIGFVFEAFKASSALDSYFLSDTNYARFMRALLHFWLFAVSMTETQIAAGVAACCAHSLRFTTCLNFALPLCWLAAGVCAAFDSSLMEVFVHEGDVAGTSPVGTAIIGSCFCLSVLLYLASVGLVLRMPRPSMVVRRAYLRALFFPCNFLVTIFPASLIYMNIVPEDVQWWLSVSGICMYSNGWVNAAAYGWIVRRVCGRRLRNPVQAGQVAREVASSFHVGFGSESCVSAAPTPLTEDSMWSAFLTEKDFSMVEEAARSAATFTQQTQSSAADQLSDPRA